ncbi:MAG: hypothetical protein R3268_01865, partial [Acidiferrobacterales bacterium]|nr:hypothetical protein [Acidiferrobacterales bacterium]
MSVTITLEQDEALVLLELLSSEKLEASVDTPERNALWALEGLLEKQLAEPFSRDYSELLQEARQSLLERYGR